MHTMWGRRNATRVVTSHPQSSALEVVVVGSGAAGLSAAVAAADEGARVLILERSPQIGGTSALSGGWMWVPGASRATAAADDSASDAAEYVRTLAGASFRSDLVRAFLESAPTVIADLERKGVRLSHAEAAPDYTMEAPGARFGGRAISAEPYDARRLSEYRLILRPPMTSMTVFGVVPQIGDELTRFLAANTSARAFAFVLHRVAAALWQRVRFGRPIRLTNGNALVAHLLEAAIRGGVQIRVNTEVVELCADRDGVTGVRARFSDGDRVIEARGGVVLACGGISHDPLVTSTVFRHVQRGQPHRSATTRGHDGAALRLAAPLGGHLSTQVSQPAAWAPVTVFGTHCARLFPHLRGIGLPGLIAVNVDGRRFTNEADSYHAFGQALCTDAAARADTHAFLLADAHTMHRYGIGYAKPWPMPRLRYYLNGYLLRGRTLAELARRCGINAENLAVTVANYNLAAHAGADPQFHRGESSYNKFRGDGTHRPNSSIGPVGDGPYYAVRIQLGDLGAFTGLDVDNRGRVLTSEHLPIAGLYAAGAAAVSPFGGAYPGYGAMLGPGVVMGARCGRFAAAGGVRA